MSTPIILTLIFFALLIVLALFIRPKPNIVIGDPAFKGKAKKIPLAIIDAGYLYSDGVETSEIRANVPIVGYRIAPALVVHDLSGKKRTDDFSKVKAFAKASNGDFLNDKDVQTLKNGLGTLNKLRQDIGEPPLPEGYFWTEQGNKAVLADFHQNDSSMKVFYNYDQPSIILKR